MNVSTKASTDWYPNVWCAGKTAGYISRAFEQYNTGDQNCIDFPLTGIKIDRTKFMLATDVQKKIIVEEQLTLLERYFSA